MLESSDYKILAFKILFLKYTDIFSFASDWRQFFFDKLLAWREMTLDWLHHFPGPLHIITYEDLVSNLPHTLLSILHFIELPAGNLTCAVLRREGIFRRRKRKTKLQPFTPEMKVQLDYEWNNVFGEINRLIDQNSSSYL